MTTQEILEAARGAKAALALADSASRAQALCSMAAQLCSPANMTAILAANADDMAAAKGHISEVMLDRLALTEERIRGKELALQFCTAYSAILSRNNVIATGTTGRMLAQTTGLPVHCYLSGKLGGVQQITSRVACDEVDLVLFFRDPLKADAASLTEQNLLRLCDMHSVPIATNIATAEVLLRGLDQGDLDYREGMHPAMIEPIPAMQARAV